MEPTNNHVADKKSDSALDDAIAKVPAPTSGNSQFPSATSTVTKAKKPKFEHRNKKRQLIVLIAIAVLVGAIFLLFWSGRIIVAWSGDGSPRVVNRQIVCDDNIQKDFFAEYSKVNFDQNKLTDKYDHIISTKNYKHDPNCLMIVFYYSTLTVFADKQAAQDAVSRLQAMNKIGLSPSSQFFSVPSWQNMDRSIQLLPKGGE